MLGAAFRYASWWAWPVFPLTPGTKTPMTVHGHRDATTNVDTIIGWWTHWPDANVGLATGWPGPDVIDIDVKDGRPGLKTMERLAKAGLLKGAHAYVETPSAGVHLYYLGTDQRCSTRAKDGIDFRAAGGYVVAPGSIVDGRRYVVMDDDRRNPDVVDWAAICRYLDPPPLEFARLGSQPGPGLAAWARRKLEQLLAEPVALGQRSERFHALVGVCKDAGMTVLETVTTVEPWCEVTGKFSGGRVDREVERCWDKVGARS